MTEEEVVEKALLECASAKELGEDNVWCIINYYLDDVGLELDYDPAWFEGWEIFDDRDEIFEKCGIDFWELRDKVAERFLEDGWNLKDCQDKILDRVSEDAWYIAQETCHIVENDDCCYLVKSR